MGNMHASITTSCSMAPRSWQAHSLQTKHLQSAPRLQSRRFAQWRAALKPTPRLQSLQPLHPVMCHFGSALCTGSQTQAGAQRSCTVCLHSRRSSVQLPVCLHSRRSLVQLQSARSLHLLPRCMRLMHVQSQPKPRRQRWPRVDQALHCRTRTLHRHYRGPRVHRHRHHRGPRVHLHHSGPRALARGARSTVQAVCRRMHMQVRCCQR